MSYPPSTYGPAAGLTAKVYETIEREGSAGCSMSQIVESTDRRSCACWGCSTTCAAARVAG
jgi:hypothetical protein